MGWCCGGRTFAIQQVPVNHYSNTCGAFVWLKPLLSERRSTKRVFRCLSTSVTKRLTDNTRTHQSDSRCLSGDVIQLRHFDIIFATYLAIQTPVLDRVQLPAVVPHQDVVHLARHAIGQRVRLQQVGERALAGGAALADRAQRVCVQRTQHGALAAVAQPQLAQALLDVGGAALGVAQLRRTVGRRVAEVVKALVLLVLLGRW